MTVETPPTENEGCVESEAPMPSTASLSSPSRLVTYTTLLSTQLSSQNSAANLKALNTPNHERSWVKAKREAIHVFAPGWFITFTGIYVNYLLVLV